MKCHLLHPRCPLHFPIYSTLLLLTICVFLSQPLSSRPCPFSPPPPFNLCSHHSSFPFGVTLGCRSPFRQPTTVSWRLWRCWGSWCSALWPEAWLIGLVSKLPSSSSSHSPPGRPCMCGRLPSLVLLGNTSSKNSPNETGNRV